MASTSCKTAVKSSCVRHHPFLVTRNSQSESLAAVHTAADRNIAADGGNPADWLCCLQTAAGFGPAGGRLSDDSGGHVLSRREPFRYGIGNYCSTRTPIGRSSGPESDAFDKFGRG